MLGPTQTELDNATMIAKYATSTLAYELALEEKYGGNVNCCVTKLKLLHLYTKAIMCQTEMVEAEGSIDILEIEEGDTISVLVAGATISGTFTATNSTVALQMGLLATQINAYQSVYEAYYDPAIGKMTVTADDCEAATMTVSTTGGPTITVASIAAGTCANNCLTDDSARALIGKIKSMCSTNRST
jgi:hypothetical protein